jgi:hypothetical protein
MREDDARERGIEFRHVDLPAADRRIIDMDAPAIEPFQHHEMIEIPVNDAWHGELVESRGLLAESLGHEPKAARRFQNICCLAAVPRHPASDP